MGRDEMGSYYRDPNLTWQLDERYNPGLALGNVDKQHADNQPDGDQAQSTGQARYCSVRGCTSVLPTNYTNKMCDVCRGRHRIYASTKRAKRKMEKAAMGMQNGWVSTEDDSPANPDPAANGLPSPETTPPDNSHPAFPYPGASWESAALDPRLFQSSTTSELAGALILPSPSRSRSPALDPVPTLHPSSAAAPDTATTPAAITAPAFSPFPQGESVQAGQPTSQKEISVQSISEVAAIQPTGSLPPRFCSIKGCKTVMDGNALFKMCDVCRSKYKTYGTTKRKKWKDEKAKALAEMEREREEQNKLRAEQGLPPLPEIGTLTWPEETMAGRAINTGIPRMCTVSHCREVLPIGYSFLRCERHRIQNRHHSKLKRVRDKDAKAQALEGFCATIAPTLQQSPMLDSPVLQDGMFVQGSSSDGAEIPIEELYKLDEQKRTEEVDLNVIQNQVVVLGVPPAARGVRRTNHACCIKGCHNLLCPTTPWKMCDDCRAHERTVRKIRALRESGVMVEPLPPRLPPREKKEKPPKEKKTKAVKRDKTADGAQSHESTPDTPEAGDGSGIVFMDPVLLDEDANAREPSSPANTRVSFIMSGPQGNVTEAPPDPPQTVETSTTANGTMAPSTPATSESAAPTGKKPTKKKAAAKAQSSSAAQSTASSSTQATAPPSNLPAIAPAPAPYPPPYPSMYYPPPPGYGMPFPQGAPYPYPPAPIPPHAQPVFSRDGFAPSPMYQPPYQPYPGYPPPYPPPYGYYPPPYAGYPQPPPPAHPMAEQPQPPTPASANPPSSASAPPVSVSGPGTPNYTVGVVSYVSAASGAVPSSMSPNHLPPPPADPSSMYSMFPVRLTDSARAPEGEGASTAPPALNGSAPVMQVVSANGEKAREGMIWVDRPPEKRKRRKADHAAVEAYMKKREEERARAEGGAGDEAESGGSSSTVGEGGDGETMPAPVPPVVEQQAPPDPPMEVDSVQAPEAPVHEPSVPQPVVEKPRSCANKMCGRALAASETSTICHRCKERMKKRAMKVKRRFKLVMPSSGKVLAKPSTRSLATVEDEDGDEGMEEVMVEEVLAQSTLST